MDMQYIAKT